MKTFRRQLLFGTGWLCVGLGIIGIVMPLFPTTPFLLVAVWAFSRSSPELAEKIRNHPIAGAYVRDWEDEGVIPPGAKMLAITMMAAMLGYLHFGSGAPSLGGHCGGNRDGRRLGLHPLPSEPQGWLARVPAR